MCLNCEDIYDAEIIYATHKISCINTQVVYQNIHKVVDRDIFFLQTSEIW